MSSEFIHNPEGIILFDEPTPLRVSNGGASSTAKTTVLPFSLRDGNCVWAGPDTYQIPNDARFTVVENIEELIKTVEPPESDDTVIDLASILNTDGN